MARESLATEPESVVQLVKRHVGSGWTFDYRGVSYRPEHVSALILRKLAQDAQLLAGPVTQAAITVPAYFSDPMRAATLRAGSWPAWTCSGLLSEPTAAALAFGYDRRPAGATGVVVDLGGGTFDVTVMEYDGAELKVRATGGDAYLGGANFDKVLFDRFVERFESAHGLDINDPDALSLDECAQVSQDWLLRAARAKHDLTSRDRTSVALQAAGLTLRVDVTRAEFVSGSAVLLDEMTEKMADVVAAAGVAQKDISVVLPVGGATRMPAVRERMKEMFGVDPDTSVRPDEAVALGAALFAAQPAERALGRLFDERDAALRALGGRPGEDGAGAAVLLIAGDALGKHHAAAEVGREALADAPVAQGERTVGGAAALDDRDPAVAALARGVEEEPRAGSGVDLRDARGASIAALAALDVGLDPAADRRPAIAAPPPRSARRPHRPGAGAAHHGGAGDGLRRQAGPDHPAAERVVLRHAVQRHQRPAGAGAGDAAQAHPLRGRVGAQAGGAAEEREAGHGGQRVVEPVADPQHRGVDRDDREGRIARGRRQLGRTTT